MSDDDTMYTNPVHTIEVTTHIDHTGRVTIAEAILHGVQHTSPGHAAPFRPAASVYHMGRGKYGLYFPGTGEGLGGLSAEQVAREVHVPAHLIQSLPKINLLLCPEGADL